MLPTDFTGCQRLWSVGPAELETGCTQSETFARSYTVTDETTGLGTKNERKSGPGERSHTWQTKREASSLGRVFRQRKVEHKTAPLLSCPTHCLSATWSHTAATWSETFTHVLHAHGGPTQLFSSMQSRISSYGYVTPLPGISHGVGCSRAQVSSVSSLLVRRGPTMGTQADLIVALARL